MSLRREVFDLDGGRCVGCGTKQRRNASAWEWSCHHAIKQQVMKARGLRPKWWRGAALAILLCRRCHERHESRTAPVPFEKLPPRVHKSVAILGPWAQDLLFRYHPPLEASSCATRSRP